jgi:predicted lipid carrier protein YhbT
VWLAAQREELQERALDDLKGRYEIVLPEDLAVSWPVASEGAQAMAAP